MALCSGAKGLTELMVQPSTINTEIMLLFKGFTDDSRLSVKSKASKCAFNHTRKAYTRKAQPFIGCVNLKFGIVGIDGVIWVTIHPGTLKPVSIESVGRIKLAHKKELLRFISGRKFRRYLWRKLAAAHLV